MTDISMTVGIVLAGLILLRIFYKAIEINWPINYITLNDSIDLIASRSIWKYFGFTLVPVYLVALLLAVNAGRIGLPSLVVGISIATIHALTHQGRGLLGTIRRFQGRIAEAQSFWVYITLIPAMIFSGFAAGSWGVPTRLDFMIPEPDEFFKALWTTALIAVFGAYLVKKYKRAQKIDDVALISMREVSENLSNLAYERAAEYRTEHRLVQAILYTENLQRPRWFRRIEHIKGWFFKSGTYGIMQVKAPGPISDEESIEIAIRDHLAGANVRTVDGFPDREQLREILHAYNSNPKFVDAAEAMYDFLWQQERELYSM
ncbi:hypothetical protein [Glycomyces salinus]|uniref:hypothetical protein n=1 Tax=Glycomyces salinus TaxID=980294 RepID=UPI0018EA4BD1|nr:hypothetical protein [Glycomyces salinus]